MVPSQDNSDIDGQSTLPERSHSNSDDAQFLEKLIEILMDSSSATDLTERVAGLIIDSTRAENSSVMLFDGSSGNLVTAGAGIRGRRAGESCPTMIFSAGEGIAGWVAENNIPVRLIDASHDRRFLHSDSSQAQVRSLFVHPITIGNRVLGVMNMSSSLPGVLGTDDEHRVELVCRHIAKGIERASELDRLRTKRIQSETMQDGNGIGLSLSRKIVQDLGGEMWVSPSLHHGATFTVDLPLIENEPVAVFMTPPEDCNRTAASRSVLVVDDEEYIADLVDTIVRDRGYQSTCCTDGQNALAMLKENEYDLLICDYHMPGTGGRELMEWIQASGKSTRVIVLSGDVVRPETRDLVEHLKAQFLCKPFGVADLLTAIEGALDI